MKPPIFIALALLPVVSWQIISLHAHQGATGIVMERMNTMKSIASEMKALKRILSGDVKYDSLMVKKAARSIKNHATQISRQYPKDSMGHPSEARENIQDDFGKFEQYAKALAEYSDILVASSDNQSKPAYMIGRSYEAGKTGTSVDFKKAPPQAAFLAMTSTCLSCHQDFRIRK